MTAKDWIKFVRESRKTYLKASGLRLGILINFGENSLRTKRIAK